ncbi:uncharacterized protein GLRG_04802 [Colletotrichum graminicola M1.001]|uniref:Xylanolytic transcriptional activator regulatory domain-containing protein n=1 Tax=Colletotrichum graminicola (strain M1.001 / M2 / FGSC 10212) TaxID=645133 RepID=E3QFM0_COLGM|nr:uncharacterized protein GLRG_04802 [Colletotrichum graminicola M1.001]EFQ29658.1 hypothetical protein GLRG_04802 [Colletotrichum graminicola M1.001]
MLRELNLADLEFLLAGSNAALVPGIGSDDSILGRLQRLEHAVFGSAASTGASADQGLVGIEYESDRRRTSNRQRIPSPSNQRQSQESLRPNERQQTAMFLDSTFTRNGFSITLPYDKIDYHVAHVSQLPKTPASTTPGQTPTDFTATRLAAWFMTHEEALLLLQDFVDHPFHLLTIIHTPAARLIIDNFYQSLALSEDPNPAYAALILSITATSAFFCNESSKSLVLFASTEEATQTALSWLKSALSILEKSSDSSCLEEVQARCVLSYLVYNMEGCSARYRFMHGSSLVAAREIGLHLIDSPSSAQQDDAITREIKRRVWVLGLMGGPTDGTYNVQLRQMNVKYPRNINDDEASLSDETFTMPPDTPTAMSCFNRRTQLSEITRSIIDARVPGVPDAEVIDYDKVLELDRLFKDVLSGFPPFLCPDGPIPSNAPRYLALQRDIVLIGFHSRRARLHRPFLLHDKQDAHYQQSREICLRSARVVLSIATSLLRASKDREGDSAFKARAIGCRLGCVIGHMFMACTILVLNAGLDPARGTQAAGEAHDSTSAATSESHTEVAQACRALASAGEESGVAKKLVRNLIGVLRRYRIGGMDDVASPESDHTPELGAEFPDNVLDKITNSTKETSGSNDDHDPGNSVMLGEDDLGLHSVWDDMLGDASAFGWDQLFAGLDTYCGPT